MSRFWEGRRVMVTGGGGFLGKAVVRRLESARAVSRGRPVERLPRRDERALWARQEDASGSGPGISAAIRVQRHSFDPGKPLRTGGQLQPSKLTCDPGAHQEMY